MSKYPFPPLGNTVLVCLSVAPFPPQPPEFGPAEISCAGQMWKLGCMRLAPRTITQWGTWYAWYPSWILCHEDEPSRPSPHQLRPVWLHAPPSVLGIVTIAVCNCLLPPSCERWTHSWQKAKRQGHNNTWTACLEGTEQAHRKVTSS